MHIESRNTVYWISKCLLTLHYKYLFQITFSYYIQYCLVLRCISMIQFFSPKCFVYIYFPFHVYLCHLNKEERPLDLNAKLSKAEETVIEFCRKIRWCLTSDEWQWLCIHIKWKILNIINECTDVSISNKTSSSICCCFFLFSFLLLNNYLRSTLYGNAIAFSFDRSY